MTGRVVGNYRILEKLGQGGMGEVYRAVDTMVERPAAIKILKPEIAGNAEVAARFHTEAVTLARLNHPAIAMLYSFFREGDEMLMAMEYVPGPTLSQVLYRDGAMPWKQASELMAVLLEGLQHAHGLGVLHRDIKPANIILPPQGGLKITDFGIAQVLGKARVTREGTIVGTLTYLAPERIQGNPAVEASDIYSAGIVFYQMLAGRVPFQGHSDFSLMRAQIEQPPPPVAQFGARVPEPILAVLNRSLEKDPAVRYTSAWAMSDALRAAIAEAERIEAARPVEAELSTAFAGQFATPTIARPVKVLPPPPTAPQPPPRKTRWPLALGIAVVLGIAGTAATWVALSKSKQPKEAEQVQASRVETHAPAPMNPQTLPPAEPVPEDVQKPAPRTPAPTKISVPPKDRAAPEPKPQQQQPAETQPETPAASTAPPSAPPRPAPAVEAKPALPTVSVLTDVKTLFVAPMPDQLEDAVRAEMNKQLRSRIRLVTAKDDGDALIQCWVEDSGGGVTSAPGRVLGVKGRKSATFKIFDRAGKQLLWQEEVSDKRGVLHFRVDSNEKLAERVVSKLKKDLK
jgi:serine/threonine-protein kinase